MIKISDIESAQRVLGEHVSPAPLIRSYALEKELGFAASRRVWIKDYGWTPVGSFKLLGALHWMYRNLDRIGDRPVAAHSSGNFASGIAFAGMRYGKRVIVVMPDTAPRAKFDRTRSFHAEIQTYDIAQDHQTGQRDRLVTEITEQQQGIQASPYDDNDVIAGNGVGGLEIVGELQRRGRDLSHFLCPVSGGGLMAGHAMAIGNACPHANIVGVEPDTAADFQRSLESGKRVRIDHPSGICDGLLSYDVGKHNWPILQQYVSKAVTVPDQQTQQAMKWLYHHHGLRTEPSGAITTAAALTGQVNFDGQGDLVLVISGRNVDEKSFRTWIGDT